MFRQNKVTGVILAGGLARRMNKQDKGLILYHNQPLVNYAIKAMSEIADVVLINANRNQDLYARFGCQIITDTTATFDGPLAGIFSAMIHANTDKLLIMPCDSPLIKSKHLGQLLTTLTSTQAEIVVAFDGQRMHPVFLALHNTATIRDSLKKFLQTGNRKIDFWLQKHRLIKADFSKDAGVFLNLNTLSDLATLEQIK